MPAILFVVGLLLGLAIDPVVALPLALIGVLLGLVLKLSKRLQALADRLAQVEARPVARPRASAADQAATPGALPPKAAQSSEGLDTARPRSRRIAPMLLKEGAPEIAPALGAAPPKPEPPAASANAVSPVPPGASDALRRRRQPVPEPTDLVSRVGEALKSFLIHGNPVVRVGIVVLFFGIAFLAKYAAESGAFPVELRLSAIAAVGVVLVAIGWRLRRSRPVYAVSLQGGGVGIFYLTVFAAFRLYGFLPSDAAFGLLLVVVVLSGALAILQNAKALAVLGSAGGFLAPVLVSTGAGSHVALFTYYLALNLGILGIGWYKAWRELNLLGFVFTFVIGATWGYRFYEPRYFGTTEPFLIAFAVLYTAVAILFALRQPPKLRGYVDGTLVFGMPLVAFALQSRLVEGTEHGLAWSAFAAAGFYLALGWALRRLGREGLVLLSEACLALAIVFATVAVPLALDARWTASTWALEGAGIVWVGARQRRLPARLFGLLVQVLAGAALVLSLGFDPSVAAFFNGHYVGAMLVAAAGIFSGVYLNRHAHVLSSWEQPLAGVALLWGVVWWGAAGAWEVVVRGIPGWDWGVLLLYFAATGLGCNLLAKREDWTFIYYPSLALLPLAFAAVAVMAVMEPHPFAALAWAGWPAVLAAHYQALYRTEHLGSPEYRIFLHAGVVWLVAAVISWELWWQLGRWFDGWGALERSAWGLGGAFVLFAAGKGVHAGRWPFDPHGRVYLLNGAGPIAAAVWLWILAMNVLPPGPGWPIDYVPILNPIDIACGFGLLAMVRWFRMVKARDETALPFEGSALVAVLGAAAFVWANGVVLRSIHFWGDVPYAVYPMFQSTLVQTSLAVFWALCALVGMVLGARRASRQVWMVSAGLMAVVVVKLFLVELANTGTLARIVSFLTVGGLMLVVGYYAPAPPRTAASGEAR